METFVVTGTALPYTPSATQSQAGIVLIGNAALDNGVAITTVGVCTNTLAATEQIDFKITGNLTGISQINYDNGAAGRTYTVLAADRTAGFATLSVTGANLLICKATETATAKALELQAANVTGTPIVTGARTVTVTLLKKTAVSAADRALIAAGTTSHTFTLDGSQYYIPLVGSSTGRETYIKLQSKSLVAGSNGVTIAILDNLGGITATWTGQIQPGIPLTISGADLVAAAATAGKTVSGSAGFAVIVTVNAPETDVFAYANMIDASGAKRIPVKTVNGVISE
jgi:hypothetical protein